MPMISEIERIFVDMDDPTRLIEKAIQRATITAFDRFGIDEFGHSDKVKDWKRKSCSLRMEFDGVEMHGGMRGWSYVVKFKAWCETNEE